MSEANQDTDREMLRAFAEYQDSEAYKIMVDRQERRLESTVWDAFAAAFRARAAA